MHTALRGLKYRSSEICFHEVYTLYYNFLKKYLDGQLQSTKTPFASIDQALTVFTHAIFCALTDTSIYMPSFQWDGCKLRFLSNKQENRYDLSNRVFADYLKFPQPIGWLHRRDYLIAFTAMNSLLEAIKALQSGNINKDIDMFCDGLTVMHYMRETQIITKFSINKYSGSLTAYMSGKYAVIKKTMKSGKPFLELKPHNCTDVNRTVKRILCQQKEGFVYDWSGPVDYKSSVTHAYGDYTFSYSYAATGSTSTTPNIAWWSCA